AASWRDRGRHHLPAASGARRCGRCRTREHPCAALRAHQGDPFACGEPAMKYISTRGGMAPQSFSDILLEGLAPDGGLALPESLPQVGADTLEAWRQLGYAELATEILALFIDDIPRADLARLTGAAYDADVFGSEQIVPLKPLNKGMTLL